MRRDRFHHAQGVRHPEPETAEVCGQRHFEQLCLRQCAEHRLAELARALALDGMLTDERAEVFDAAEEFAQVSHGRSVRRW